MKDKPLRIKPCKECGAQGYHNAIKLDGASFTWHDVTCIGCGLETSSVHTTKEKAIEAWNDGLVEKPL